MNRDGVPDIVVGSYTSSDGAPLAGRVDVYSGRTGRPDPDLHLIDSGGEPRLRRRRDRGRHRRRAPRTAGLRGQRRLRLRAVDSVITDPATTTAPGSRLTWAEPAADQFEFWHGTWHAETVAGGTDPPVLAFNEVTWLWGRAALVENFSMPVGRASSTAAVSAFRSRAGAGVRPGWTATDSTSTSSAVASMTK